MVSKQKYSEIANVTFLTSSEAALYLYAHKNTVIRWEKKGLLQAYRIGPRGDRRFRLEELEKFVEAQRKRC
jgi:excisionase family DNA binding protein